MKTFDKVMSSATKKNITCKGHFLLLALRQLVNITYIFYDIYSCYEIS